MITYTYIVRCPECEDEFFDFFDEAKDFAMGCLTKKPIITQTEVNRNDFGECTDHCDLGTVWSWEDMMRETDAEPATSVFNKDDLKLMADGKDPEFDAIDNSVDFEIPEVSEREPITEAKTDPFHEAIFEAIDYLTEFNDIFPVPDNIGADTWKELKDDINYGLSSDFEIAEIIMEYLDKDLAISRKHPEMFEDDPQSELTLETYNRLKRAYDRAVAAYEAEHPEDFEEAFHYDSLRDKEYDDALDSLDKPLPEYRYTLDPETGKYTSVLVNRDQFTADELKKLESCERKPIPEGMTIEELVEEMEENEDTVECTWCNDLFDKSECRKEVDLGWLCSRCEMAIKSRGETLTFRENNYWDFLDEDIEDTRTLADLVKDSINHLTNDLGKDPWAEGFADEVIGDIERNYETYVPEDMEHYNRWCDAVASEVSRQLNNPDDLTEASLTDIVAGVNHEYGTNYTERDILDAEGIDDGEFFNDLETQNEITAEAQRRQRQRRAYAISKAKAKREANKI